MNNQNKALKTGRLISAIIFLLIGAFSFSAVAVEFNIPFLVVGILCVAFAVYTLVKSFVAPKEKQERQEDFEL
ncbi:hypothetical protein RB620_24730 [Paenibacillus sp. LHD-117]|uniref:hypothetical protein n=1 Tax=Paenibacillus sp. LHD-117 TaxID=3071412 RepID=UPI0027E1EE60|nr:hypothetical protein [Paenibacillus sp. LHD-117]MDQ6422643.1 hypothetical protein [Paenibacillus sp. LHD-117]